MLKVLFVPVCQNTVDQEKLNEILILDQIISKLFSWLTFHYG